MLQGVLGLPVFAGTPEKGLGLVYILGPTGGYLLGFYLAIIIMGIFSTQNTYQNYWKNLVVLIAANLSIYIQLLWELKYRNNHFISYLIVGLRGCYTKNLGTNSC